MINDKKFIEDLIKAYKIVGEKPYTSGYGISYPPMAFSPGSVNIVPAAYLNGTNRIIRQTCGSTTTLQVAEEDYYRFLFIDGVSDDALDAAVKFAHGIVKRFIDAL